MDGISTVTHGTEYIWNLREEVQKQKANVQARSLPNVTAFQIFLPANSAVAGISELSGKSVTGALVYGAVETGLIIAKEYAARDILFMRTSCTRQFLRLSMK